MATTSRLRIDRDHPDPSALQPAADCLRAGGLVAFATETVYGLGADATNPEAIERIYVAKGRPPTNPLIVHVSDVAMARRFAAQWSDDAERLAAALWPGPVTLVLPKVPEIPDRATAGLATVGLRVPATAVARALIAAAGCPVAAPSANRSEHVSPTTADHVLDDLEGRIDIVVDSGPTSLGIESSVIALTEGEPRLLRPGPVSPERLGEILGRPVAVGAAVGETTLASPGQHARHYAPRTPCLRFDRLDTVPAVGPGDAVLSFGPEALALPGAARVERLSVPEIAATRLYGLLRELDGLGLDHIFVVMPPATPPWRAITDRLVRATVPGPPR